MLIYLKVLPRLMEIFGEVPKIQGEKIEDRILFAMVGYFIFALAINFFAWKVANKIETKEMETQTILRINPKDLSLQEKLKKLQKQKQFYFLLDPLLMIIIGLMVGFIAVTILQPLYSLTSSL